MFCKLWRSKTFLENSCDRNLYLEQERLVTAGDSWAKERFSL